MKVKMNEKEIELFAGAKVRDVILQFSKTEFKAVENNKRVVVDKYKNPVDLDGSVSEGQIFFTQEREEVEK